MKYRDLKWTLIVLVIFGLAYWFPNVLTITLGIGVGAYCSGYVISLFANKDVRPYNLMGAKFFGLSWPTIFKILLILIFGFFFLRIYNNPELIRTLKTFFGFVGLTFFFVGLYFGYKNKAHLKL